MNILVLYVGVATATATPRRKSIFHHHGKTTVPDRQNLLLMVEGEWVGGDNEEGGNCGKIYV